MSRLVAVAACEPHREQDKHRPSPQRPREACEQAERQRPDPARRAPLVRRLRQALQHQLQSQQVPGGRALRGAAGTRGGGGGRGRGRGGRGGGSMRAGGPGG